MEQNVLSVSALNRYLKMLIEGDDVLNFVTLRGEISNFKYHSSGHLYFTLKDSESEIAAVMFRSAASSLGFRPTDGMSVTAYGRVSVYEKSGRYQLYVSAMTEDGRGRLYAELERLKAKLSAEGLFDESRKKPLPAFPKCVGIITSPTGAAIRDMLNISGRRYPAAKILIYPSLVQGADAPAELCRGIELFNAEKSCDVIIIGRGGGSIEDLWAFNNETLVRRIAASEIPVISAVGHETDFTLCDFAADKRAPTPSAAAELALPDKNELLIRLDEAGSRLDDSAAQAITKRRKLIERYASILEAASPEARVAFMRSRLKSGAELLDKTLDGFIAGRKSALCSAAGRLDAMNPLAVLKRGYTAVRNSAGNVIGSVSGMSEGDDIRLLFSDGEAEARITDIKETGLLLGAEADD